MIAKHLIPIEEYKEPGEFTKQQLKIFWLPDEINVEKDIQDVLVNFTPSERHGVITTLKLFSLYELQAGSEYWGSRFKKMFDGPEFHKMASVFSTFELAIHEPFYKKINELLHIDTLEFYSSYVDSPVLKSRMDFISDIINDPDDLVSLGGFSLVEGVVLYSNFGYLKHFQNQGKNKLMNVGRGLDFSTKDENIHFQASAWSFKHKLSKSNLTDEQKEALKQRIIAAAHSLYEHEKEIINMIFEKGPQDGITKIQLLHFVESRIDECLVTLGYEKIHKVKYNVIAEWFYKGLNNFQFNDFFTGLSAGYHRNWDETRFVWKKKEQE